jgi:tetratricopeptide (TPR) repeat protein
MRYYDKGEFKKFLKEMDCIIAAKPFDDKSYEQTIDMLIDAKQFNEAIPYLEKLQSLKPSFFTAKWLGYIALQNKNYGDAEKYLEESVSYSDKDYQVWYNLAGIYYNKKEFNKSLIAIERSLALNPDYPYAKNIYQQLKNLINK